VKLSNRTALAFGKNRFYAEATADAGTMNVTAEGERQEKSEQGEKGERQEKGSRQQRQVGGVKRQRPRRGDSDSFFSDWDLGFPSLTSVFRGPTFMDWFGSPDLPLLSEQAGNLPTTINPKVDVYETDKNYAIDVEVPGMKKDELSIRIENDYLTISGEKRFEKEERDKKHKFRRMERAYGSFQRSFELPEGIDQSQIEAKYVDGVLKITVEKPPESAQREGARQIEIKEVKE